MRYFSKSGIREVEAAEAHFFEVEEENEVGGGTRVRYQTTDSAKVQQTTYSDLDGGEYKLGIRQGPYYIWHSNGNLKEQGYYSNNKLNGEYKAWYESGQLRYTRYYHDNLAQDTLKAYYETGDLRRIEVYKKGEMTSGKLYNEAGEEVKFFPMEQMPEFPGGEYAMLRYLASNIKFPKSMYKAGVQGLVVLTFLVDEQGRFKDVETVKSLHPDGDAEALRVLHSMPAWKPGFLEGKPVEVRYTLPVRYTIR